MRIRNLATAIMVALVVFVFATVSHAAIIISVAEDSGDVVFSYSGDLDTAGLVPKFVTSGCGLFVGSGGDAVIAFGLGGATCTGGNLQGYSGVSSFESVSSSPTAVIFGSTTGSGFALFAGDTIALPFFYISGDPLAGTLTLDGQTFASLFLIDGIYQADLPSGDFVQLIIDTQQVPVPEPTTLLLLGGGLAAAGIRRFLGCQDAPRARLG